MVKESENSAKMDKCRSKEFDNQKKLVYKQPPE
jgi:hypothetical protein